MEALSQFLKKFLFIILGLVIGGLVNYGIIILTSSLAPRGVDSSDIESIKQNIQHYTPFHFLWPFLAHALGTLVGAFLALRWSKSKYNLPAYIVGGFFLVGGIMMVIQLPTPLWYSIIDLGFAYIPMAWLATKLVR